MDATIVEVVVQENNGRSPKETSQSVFPAFKDQKLSKELIVAFSFRRWGSFQLGQPNIEVPY